MSSSPPASPAAVVWNHTRQKVSSNKKSGDNMRIASTADILSPTAAASKKHSTSTSPTRSSERWDINGRQPRKKPVPKKPGSSKKAQLSDAQKQAQQDRQDALARMAMDSASTPSSYMTNLVNRIDSLDPTGRSNRSSIPKANKSKPAKSSTSSSTSSRPSSARGGPQLDPLPSRATLTDTAGVSSTLNLEALAQYLTPAQAAQIHLYPQLLVQAAAAAQAQASQLAAMEHGGGGGGRVGGGMLGSSASAPSLLNHHQHSSGDGQAPLQPFKRPPPPPKSTDAFLTQTFVHRMQSGQGWDDSFAAATPPLGTLSTLARKKEVGLFGTPPPVGAVKVAKLSPWAKQQREINRSTKEQRDHRDRSSSPSRDTRAQPLTPSRAFATHTPLVTSPFANNIQQQQQQYAMNNIYPPFASQFPVQPEALFTKSNKLEEEKEKLNAASAAAAASDPTNPPFALPSDRASLLRSDLAQSLFDLSAHFENHPTRLEMASVAGMASIALHALDDKAPSLQSKATDSNHNNHHMVGDQGNWRSHWDCNPYIEKALGPYLVHFSSAREKYHLQQVSNQSVLVSQGVVPPVPTPTVHPLQLYTSPSSAAVASIASVNNRGFAPQEMDLPSSNELIEQSLTREMMASNKWFLAGFAVQSEEEKQADEAALKQGVEKNESKSGMMTGGATTKHHYDPIVNLKQLQVNSTKLGLAAGEFAPHYTGTHSSEMAFVNPSGGLVPPTTQQHPHHDNPSPLVEPRALAQDLQVLANVTPDARPVPSASNPVAKSKKAAAAAGSASNDHKKSASLLGLHAPPPLYTVASTSVGSNQSGGASTGLASNKAILNSRLTPGELSALSLIESGRLAGLLPDLDAEHAATVAGVAQFEATERARVAAYDEAQRIIAQEEIDAKLAAIEAAAAAADDKASEEAKSAAATAATAGWSEEEKGQRVKAKVDELLQSTNRSDSPQQLQPVGPSTKPRKKPTAKPRVRLPSEGAANAQATSAASSVTNTPTTEVTATQQQHVSDPAQQQQQQEQKDQAEQEEAAVKIQAAFKGSQVRAARKKADENQPLNQTNVDEDREEQEKAAVKIQAVYKGSKVRSSSKKKKVATALHKSDSDQELDQQERAAVKIQSVYKGSKVRSNKKKKQQQPNQVDSADLTMPTEEEQVASAASDANDSEAEANAQPPNSSVNYDAAPAAAAAPADDNDANVEIEKPAEYEEDFTPVDQVGDLELSSSGTKSSPKNALHKRFHSLSSKGSRPGTAQ